MPEPTKTWLAVKPYASQRSTKTFFGTKIKIINGERRFLGGTANTEKFIDSYIEEKVIE